MSSQSQLKEDNTFKKQLHYIQVTLHQQILAVALIESGENLGFKSFSEGKYTYYFQAVKPVRWLFKRKDEEFPSDGLNIHYWIQKSAFWDFHQGKKALAIIYPARSTTVFNAWLLLDTRSETIEQTLSALQGSQSLLNGEN